MSSKQAVGLAGTRLNEGPKVPALSSAHHRGQLQSARPCRGPPLSPGGTAPGGF